jgi:hypothetical protein
MSDSAWSMVDNFRVLDQQVWISVRGHDYPIDNLKQIVPEARQGEYLSQMADQLLGKHVAYKNEKGEIKGGTVSAVKYDDKGSLQVQIGESAIPFTQVVQIGGTSVPP